MNKLSKDKIKKLCYYNREIIFSHSNGIKSCNMSILNNQSFFNIVKTIEYNNFKNVFIIDVRRSHFLK